MKIIRQLFWIFLFSLLGELLSILIRSIVAIPGSVIGMVLLFIALHYNWLAMEDVEDVGTWLTDNMAIFFVPAGVGLMTNFDILGGIWWQLLLILLISVVVLIGIVGHIVQAIKRKQEPHSLQEEGKVDKK